MGYFWPIVKKDAKDFVKKVELVNCMTRFREIPQHSSHKYIRLIPFAMWGLDITGLFLPSIAQAKFISW